MMVDDPTRIVAEGYDRIAERYREWSGADPVRLRLLKRLTGMLPHGGSVLDIGCGAGVPVAQELARHCEVVGIDISGRQVALARRNVPRATFIHGDVMTAELAAGSFDAVTAFFAVTHLPRDEHPLLLARVFDWLKPGGVFLASFGTKSSEATEADWLGAPMFFSQFDAPANLRLIREAGFEIVTDEILSRDEDGVAVDFLWVTAQRPARPTTAGIL